MIKTLRITSIALAALAVVVFVLPILYGFQSDPAVEEFLNRPGVIEKFKQAALATGHGTSNQVSPLLKQAQALGLFLDPPKPTPVVNRTPPRPVNPVSRTPRGAVSAKFTLIATCASESDPQKSLAFIDEPGRGLHWVEQSDKVMHLAIEQIRDGVIVVRDSQGTYEYNVPEQGKSGSSRVMSTVGRIPATNTRISANNVSRPAATPGRQVPKSTPAPQPTAAEEEEAASLNALMERLKSIQQSEKSNKTDSGSDQNEDPAALMNQIITNYKSPSRVSEQEAKKLDDLGRKLDGNQPKSNSESTSSTAVDRSVPRRPARMVGGTPR